MIELTVLYLLDQIYGFFFFFQLFETFFWNWIFEMDRLLSTAMKSIRAIGDCGEGGNKKKEYLLFSSLFFHFFFFFLRYLVDIMLAMSGKQAETQMLEIQAWKFSAYRWEQKQPCGCTCSGRFLKWEEMLRKVQWGRSCVPINRGKSVPGCILFYLWHMVSDHVKYRFDFKSLH